MALMAAMYADSSPAELAEFIKESRKAPRSKLAASLFMSIG